MEILPELLAAFDVKKRALIKELADFKDNPYDKLRQRFAASIEGPNERTRVALEMGRPEDAIYEGFAPDPSGVSGLGKAMFVGAKAALNPVTKGRLLEARELLEKGLDNEAIRQMTGWFRGPDGKWRTEISDQLADITPVFQKMRPEDMRSLPETFDHPDLYKLYPQLQRAVTKKTPSGDNYGSMHSPGTFFSDRHLVDVADMLPTDQSRSTFLHELQHAVQNIEGFEPGGNFHSPRVTQYLEDWKDRVRQRYIEGGASGQDMQVIEDKYLSNPSREQAKRIEGYERLAGEAEARLTEARANLGAKGRMDTPLQYDVPKEELIFHGRSGGPVASMAPEGTDIYRNQLAPYQHQVYDRLILMGTPPEEAIQRTRTLTNLMQVLPSK